MRRLPIIFSIVYLFISSYPIIAQNIIRNSSIVAECYAGNKVTRIYIPPPKDFYNKKGSKGATITVSYTGFPTAAKAAVDYAISILSSLLPRDAKFTIYATWKSLGNTSTLANTGVPILVTGSFINALSPSVYYPIALAEKIAEKSLNNDTEDDIDFNVNSSINWYTGTDGHTPSSMYDLVTVTLHEICHGLGFYESFSATNPIGSYGLSSLPLIYDTFIENSSGVRLTDTTSISNNSQALYSQLTGNQLYFNGPLLKKYLIDDNKSIYVQAGYRASIFAPQAFNAGSSISHLDESLARTLQRDALMTPFINLAEAIHNPGDLTFSILGDMGWINTTIIHNQFHDTEKHLSNITFSAKINSDTLFLRDSVGVVYSFDNSANYDTLYLLPPQADDSFRVSLNIPAYNTSLSYYFFLTDCFKRLYKLPSYGETSPYKFFIGTDTVKPTILHYLLDYFFDKTPSVKFIASADDNIGIDTVYIEYKKNNNTLKVLGLSNDSLDIFSGTLNLKPESITGGDSIRYRIVAKDKSSSGNLRKLPSSGYYTIHFEPTLSVIDGYNTDFTNAANDFVCRGFSIAQPPLFTNPALHSRHPYESPGTDGDSIVYATGLKHPVKVDATGLYITFQEIVLVEPGLSGSVFGSPDFFDYVIVEASKNFGKSWFMLAPGYDCRIAALFQTAWKSAEDPVSKNSSYQGQQSMYIKHTIDIRSFTTFSIGDSLLVRFRLYSDPSAYGWGWAIDDLDIKSVAAGVPETYASGFNIYPNPGDGHIKIDPGGISNGRQLTYNVLNSAGFTIQEGKINVASLYSIDISNQPSGLYIIVLKSDNKIRAVKYSLIKE